MKVLLRVYAVGLLYSAAFTDLFHYYSNSPSIWGWILLPVAILCVGALVTTLAAFITAIVLGDDVEFKVPRS